jgi:hypothetical protein
LRSNETIQSRMIDVRFPDPQDPLSDRQIR